MNLLKTKQTKHKVKRVFLKKGTCSHAYFYILNREFGTTHEHEELAIDPLAGGILQQGYQCGMLWGASMAVGAEAYRRFNDIEKACAVAIPATKKILESFTKRTGTIECHEITNCDFGNKWSFARYMFSGKFYSCYKLAAKWAPEAVDVAHQELSDSDKVLPESSKSCASEVVKKMGGSEEEMAMVAGYAGGLGLSGNGCGALSAAIWKTILNLVKNDNWKSKISDPDSEVVLQRFLEASNYELECKLICGRQFNTVREHTEFLISGGCQKIIEKLAGE